MKKFYIVFLFWSLLKTCFAFDRFQIPDDFEITQHWISFTTSFDMTYHHKKIGSLYRRALTPILTYDFYDAYDQKIAKAKARVFSYIVKFDVYDANHQRLGVIKEDLFRFFPTFSLFSHDGRKLAEACLNFWGTTFSIYDSITHEEIAYMTRGFFRLKNDWEVHISNRPLFEARNIDACLFLTALAFQGDREDWTRDNQQNQPFRQFFQTHLTKQKANASETLTTSHRVLMEVWAKRWDQKFKTTYPDYFLQDPKANLEGMLKTGLELRRSPDLTLEDRQALEDLFQFIRKTEEN